MEPSWMVRVLFTTRWKCEEASVQIFCRWSAPSTKPAEKALPEMLRAENAALEAKASAKLAQLKAKRLVFGLPGIFGASRLAWPM